MPHGIENDKFFAIGQKPWHIEGIVFPDGFNDIEAMKARAFPDMYAKTRLRYVIENADGTLSEGPLLERYAGIIRGDGKEISAVGADYCVEQPSEKIDDIMPLVQTGRITIESAGTLADGRKIFVLFKLKESEVIKGDLITGYLLYATSYDGSLKSIIRQTNTRVVCNNTLEMAMKGNTRFSWAFKHTKNLHTRIDNANTEIAKYLNVFDDGIKQYQVLASKHATTQELKTYVERVFELDTTKPEEVSTKLQTKVDHVLDLLCSTSNYDMVPTARGTYWQGYNAVTQYLTHEQGRNEKTRLNNLWFGSSVDLSQKALSMALDA